VTDALVAIVVAASIVQLSPDLRAAAFGYGFSPAAFLGGGWRDPLAYAGPLVSQFLLGGIANTLFNAVLLLIAGRYAEKALGGWGLLAVFGAGAYAGAIARLALTAQSILVTDGVSAALFAIVGATLMLYGVPASIPINHNYSRVLQILALAAIWAVIQVAFMLSAGVFEVSVSLINPLAGLLAGVLIGLPLLAWRYRKA